MAVSFSAAQKRAFHSAQQRAETAQAKGFLAFQVEGVLVRFAGKGEKFPDANVRKRLGPMLRLCALYLAGCKKRIAQGRTATRPDAYRRSAMNKRGYLVSSLYASRAGTRGKVQHDSSAAFHSAANAKPGFVTGLMLKGLVSRSIGRHSVTMGAEGSSIGSNTYVRSIAAGERGNKRGKKTKHKVGKFVRNQWKLNSVFRGVNVNVIQPTTKEVAAMSAAVGVGLHREAFGMLAGQSSINDATVQRQLAAGGALDRDLYRKLMQTWVKAH